MKKLITILAAAVAAVAVADDNGPLTGVDSLAVGNMAGMGGHANRTLAIGIASGAYVQNCDSNSFIGVASGLRANNLQSCVGVGHYALRYTQNMKNVVAIGDLALAGRRDLQNATWINGQFYCDGDNFYIMPSRDANITNAPLWYRDGVLHLNATNIVDGSGGKIGSGNRFPNGITIFGGEEGGGDDGIHVFKNYETGESEIRLFTSYQTFPVGATIVGKPRTGMSPFDWLVNYNCSDGSKIDLNSWLNIRETEMGKPQFSYSNGKLTVSLGANVVGTIDVTPPSE